MRPAVIAVIGVVGLVGVFLFELYLPLLLVLLNGLALGLILTGTIVPISSRMGRVVIQFKEGMSTPDESLWPCIQGKRVNPNFPRPLEFHLEPRSMFPLLFAGVLSLLAIAFAFQVHRNLFSAYQSDSGWYVLMFVFVFLTFIPLGLAGSWFRERLLLARSLVTMGNLHRGGKAYSFVDQNGANFGGIGKSRTQSADNACLVFYSPMNPEFNKPSSGLLFHRLVLH